MNNFYDLIIVGAGAAGITLAEQVRKYSSDISIALFSDEEILPYYRTKLPSFINKNIDNSFYIHSCDWYIEKNISLFLNNQVNYIDTINHQIKIKDKFYHYRDLVLSCGAEPIKIKINPAVDGKICYMRRYADLINLKKKLLTIKNNKITIIGAGLIGLEIAHYLSLINKYEISLIELSDRILPKQLDITSSNILLNTLLKRNIQVYLSSKVENIIEYNDKLVIELNSQHAIDTDLIISTIGVKPALENIHFDNVEISNGIKVNLNMKVDCIDIYSCGDVATFDYKNPGTWSFATETAKVVAKNIIGIKDKYTPKEYPYFLNVFDLSLVSLGDVNSNKQHDITNQDEIEYFNKENNIYRKVCVTNSKISGFILLNDLKMYNLLYKMFTENQPLSDSFINLIKKNR